MWSPNPCPSARHYPLLCCHVRFLAVLCCVCRKCKPEMADDAFAPIAEQLLVIMSHLFQRLPLHSSRLLDSERIRTSPSKARVEGLRGLSGRHHRLLLLEPHQEADLQTRSLTTASIHHSSMHPTQLGIAVSPTLASQVVLEPLPPAVQSAMDSHNSATLQLFVDYVRCYVGSLGAQLTEEQVLPLSGAVLPVGPAPADGSHAALWSGSGTTTSLKQLLDTQRVHFQVLHARGWFGLEERQQSLVFWDVPGQTAGQRLHGPAAITLSSPTIQKQDNEQG